MEPTSGGTARPFGGDRGLRPARHRRPHRGPQRLRDAPGDYFDLVASNELRLPDGKHFCIYALAAVLPFLAAKQRQHPPGDWLEHDTEVCCPDPEERLMMRIERIGVRRLRTTDLT